MRLQIMLRRLTGIAGCLVLLGAPLLAADKIPSDRRLPANTLLTITCPDVPQSLEQFHKTSFGALLKDASLDKFKGQIEEVLQEKSKEIQEQLGIPVEDLQALAAGEVTIAVVRPSNEPLAGLLFMDIGENQETLNALLEKGENVEGLTIEKETQSVQGVDVTVCTASREGESPKTFAFFTKDQMFVVGSSLSVMKGVIQRWGGDQPKALADADVYKTIMARCRTSARTPAALTWYVDPVNLVTAGLAMVPQAQMASVLLTANLSKVGLDKLKAIGGVSEFATSEFDSVSRTLIYATPPATGLLKVFELRPTVKQPAAWVPGEVTQYLATDWNVPGAYDAIQNMYDSITGQPGAFEAVVGGLLQLPDGTSVNLKKDIVDVLSGSVEGYTVNPDEGDDQELYGVISIGLADAAKGKELVERALKLQGEVRTESASGATIYQSADEDQPWAVAVKGKAIFAANDIDMLKEALSGKTENSLAASEGYQAVKKHLPAAVALLMFQDPAEQLKQQYESLRKGEYDGLTEGKVDFSTLPPFEELEEYFNYAASYIIPDENGALHVSFGLKADE